MRVWLSFFQSENTFRFYRDILQNVLLHSHISLTFLNMSFKSSFDVSFQVSTFPSNSLSIMVFIEPSEYSVNQPRYRENIEDAQGGPKFLETYTATV